MPTYEYICGACDYAFEKFQSITAAPIKQCPKCGKNKAQRKISGGAGFIFKGGGFYETDYRSEGYKKAAEADKAATTPASGDAKPAESKPADAKTDAKTEPAAKPAETKSTPAAPPPTASSSKPAKGKPKK